MEIRITTEQVLKVLHVVSWIIFVGLCVNAGGIAVNTFIAMFINPLGVKNFWDGKEYLSHIYFLDKGHFFAMALTMIIVALLKAVMFYLIIKLFAEKKLNITQPFNVALRRFILRISYLAAGIGLFSHFGAEYSEWLTSLAAEPADLKALHIAGADVWLFMAVILFLIAQVVKRGIELQNESDLTI